MATTDGAAPGWYPDPGGSSAQRWWDGAAWTAQLDPAGTTSPARSGPAEPIPAGPHDRPAPGPPARGLPEPPPPPPVIGVPPPPDPAGAPPGRADERRQLILAAGALAIVVLVAALALTRPPGDAPTAAEPSVTAAPSGDGRVPGSLGAADRPPAPGGVPFTDPEGEYVLELGPGWVDVDAKVVGVEAWLTGDTVGDFRDNLNVSTEVAVGLSTVEEGVRYVRRELEQNAVPGLSIEAVDYVTSTTGRPVGRLTLANLISNREARQRVYVVVAPRGLLILTVSVLRDRADRVFAEVEPYALTLDPA